MDKNDITLRVYLVKLFSKNFDPSYSMPRHKIDVTLQCCMSLLFVVVVDKAEIVDHVRDI